jgi:hypothetical protein
MFNRKHGLTAAKDLLRHANIGITAQQYIAVSGDRWAGALLSTESEGRKIIKVRRNRGPRWP